MHVAVNATITYVLSAGRLNMSTDTLVQNFL